MAGVPIRLRRGYGGQAGIGFGLTALGAIALDAKRRPLSLRYAPVVEPHGQGLRPCRRRGRRFSDIVRDISAARRLPEIPTTETPGIGLN